jgi:hypothetical protein
MTAFFWCQFFSGVSPFRSQLFSGASLFLVPAFFWCQPFPVPALFWCQPFLVPALSGLSLGVSPFRFSYLQSSGVSKFLGVSKALMSAKLSGYTSSPMLALRDAHLSQARIHQSYLLLPFSGAISPLHAG